MSVKKQSYGHQQSIDLKKTFGSEGQGRQWALSSPVTIVIAALTLTIVLLMGLGWQVWQSYINHKETEERIFPIQGIRADIINFDEVLTMSTNMSAATGDPQWEKRYRQFEPQLDLAIKNLRELVPETFDSAAAIQTDEANVKLVEMENQVFELVGEDRLDEAEAIISGNDYREQKRLYSEGMQRIADDVENYITDDLESNRKTAIIALASTLLALPLLALLWLWVLRNMRQYLKKRNLAEQLLRESEVRFRSLVGNIPEVVYRCGIPYPWAMEYVSEAIFVITGYHADDFLEGRIQGIGELIVPEDVEDVKRLVAAAIAAHRPFESKYRIQHAEGGFRWVHEKGRAIFNGEGKPLWLDGVILDITECKQAEMALEESHERFVTIMDSLEALVYVADFDTHEILFINRFGRNVWGNVVGNKCWQSLQAGQAGPCEFCTNGRLLNENGEATGVYTWELQNTVNYHWYECHDQAIQWTDGRFVRMEIATDITERKQAHDALRDKTKEMETMLRGVSHDLRSPLVNIDGFCGELTADCKLVAKMLENVTTDKKTKQQLETLTGRHIPESLNFIHTGTKKMESLLKALSNLAKIGTAKLDIQPLDVNDLVGQVVGTMKFSAKKANATIELETLPDCLGDEVQINQVFSNLIGNAIKYFDPDRPARIWVWGRVEGDMSQYCVEDNGIGISDYHKPKVFEIFHRVDPKSAVSGDGLGLTTTKQIVERHNGRIWLKSEEGKGSKFFVSLPSV